MIVSLLYLRCNRIVNPKMRKNYEIVVIICTFVDKNMEG